MLRYCPYRLLLPKLLSVNTTSTIMFRVEDISALSPNNININPSPVNVWNFGVLSCCQTLSLHKILPGRSNYSEQSYICANCGGDSHYVFYGGVPYLQVWGRWWVFRFKLVLFPSISPSHSSRSHCYPFPLLDKFFCINPDTPISITSPMPNQPPCHYSSHQTN